MVSGGGRAERALGPDALDRVVVRLAHDIHDRVEADERGPRAVDPSTLALIGIRTGGAHLAYRLARALSELRQGPVPVGLLDITLYRDDVMLGGNNPLPLLHGTEIDFDIQGRSLVLVDDVLYTGRTVRAALGALLDLGRPAQVRLAVLVDRGLRELPVAADFVGRDLATSPHDHVEVRLTEEGAEIDEVVVERPHGRREDDGSNDGGER